MLGNFGQLMNLMKNAGQIKQNMESMQQELEAARFEGEAGGGQVRATVNGKGDLVSLKLEPALVEAGDAEMIEDLTVAAVRAATTCSREAMQAQMSEMMGGMGLPGIDNLLGGQQQ